MNAAGDLVVEAADLIDYDSYVREPDGPVLSQSSAPNSILSMLRLLELQPGMRVLEVGTGSGYTGALLARIVGQRGSVTSLDIDPSLVARAERKHFGYGLRNVAVHTADGVVGWAAGGPYDRIVGWATPHLLPRRWVEQARDQAVIVTPIKVAPIAGANMILRADMHGWRPTARDVHLGGYIEMHSQVITDFPGARALPRRDPPAAGARRLGQRIGATGAPGASRCSRTDDCLRPAGFEPPRT